MRYARHVSPLFTSAAFVKTLTFPALPVGGHFEKMRFRRPAALLPSNSEAAARPVPAQNAKKGRRSQVDRIFGRATQPPWLLHEWAGSSGTPKTAGKKRQVE
ncbi:unnamed protein product, partial [Iphiclides podalirius]